MWRRLLSARRAGAGPPGSTGPALAPATALDERLMRRALDLARRAAESGEVPVGAVVALTETGEVLGEGHNRREADRDPAAHAEVIAVRAAAARLGDWRLNACTLAVTLEPCAMCAGLIVNARVGRVVFGAPDPKAGAVVSLYTLLSDRRLNHRPAVAGGVLAPEAGALLREFFRARRAAS